MTLGLKVDELVRLRRQCMHNAARCRRQLEGGEEGLGLNLRLWEQATCDTEPQQIG